MKKFKYFFSFLLMVLLVTIKTSAEDKMIMVDGTLREYIIEVPSNYDGTVPHDLILVYHGMGGTAQQTTFTAFHNSGNSDKFITIYPQGLDDIDDFFNPGEFTTGWKFEVQNNRDVTFTEVLLDTLNDEYNLKENGVYVTGISNGGYFSDILACNIGDNLAAIAPVIGGYPLDLFPCVITQILPVLHLGSEHDAIVDIANLRDATKFWKDHNEYKDSTQEGICMIYTGTDPDAVVYHCEFECLVNGVPVTEKNASCHTWPTAFTGYEFETTEMILDFFRDNGLGDNSNAITFQEFFTSPDNGIILIDKETITFELSRPLTVTLDIYNLRGVRLKRMVHNRYMAGGKHRVRIDQSRLGSGAYLLQLKVGSSYFSKKLLLAK